MKLASLLLLWVATICMCTAVPSTNFGGLVHTQQVDVDRCATETVIQIPMWFCTNILLENRPQWLRMICDTVQQTQPTTKVQQITGGERIVPNWICGIQTEEKRLQQINNICSTILKFNLQELFEIPYELCALGDSITERVLADCGSPPNPEERPETDERPRTFPRRRRWTGVDKEVQTQQIADPQLLCSHLDNPELLLTLNALCAIEGITPEDYGIPQIVCDAKPESRIELLRTACIRITVGERPLGSKVQTQQTADPLLCSRLANPGDLLPVLNTVCGLKTINPADYIPQIICDARPENRIEVLKGICPEIPREICEKVGNPYFQYTLKTTNCRELPNIPDGICDLRPELRVQAIEGLCGATSMIDAIAENQEMTKIPKWICDSIPKLGLPKWLSNICEMNEKLPTPGEICCNDESNTS